MNNICLLKLYGSRIIKEIYILLELLLQKSSIICFAILNHMLFFRPPRRHVVQYLLRNRETTSSRANIVNGISPRTGWDYDDNDDDDDDDHNKLHLYQVELFIVLSQVEKHEEICLKTGQKKRKAFDMTKARVKVGKNSCICICFCLLIRY